MHPQHNLGQLGLHLAERLGVATLPGRGQVDAVDELHQQVAERLVERADLPAIHLRRRHARLAEQVELHRLVGVGAVDAVRGNFDDGPVAVGSRERQRVTDRAALQRLDLGQLRRRSRPLLNDLAEHLPRNVDGHDGHATVALSSPR